MHDDDMTQADAQWAPWPGPVNVEGIAEGVELEVNSLTPEQDARATALFHARGVLEKIGPTGIGRAEGERTPPARMDLLSVATWIMTGSAHVD